MTQAMPAAVDPFADFEAEARSYLVDTGVPLATIQFEIPAEREFGELSSNCAFLLAKEWRRSPREISRELASDFDPRQHRFVARVEAAGNGFVNFFLNHGEFLQHATASIERAGGTFGTSVSVGKPILIEHTSVNPNKEWHAGHLRNAAIGDTLVRIARQVGHTVEVQNYIDDTGRQAAEAVLALRQYDVDVSAADEKLDHFVGRPYVRLNAELTEGSPERKAELNDELVGVLHEMEAGDHRSLLEKIVTAQLSTAARIGATYDLLVWESDIVRARLFDEGFELLKRSPRVFTPTEGEYQGALVIAVGSQSKGTSDNSDTQLRVLVRSNGIPTYTGKDIPYMMWKFGLLTSKLPVCPFSSPAGKIRSSCPAGEAIQRTAPDEVINVVGEHQALQQRTVIEGLAAAGYDSQAARAHHLSYGMVSQTSGRISGRKGAGSAADDIIDEAKAVAARRVKEKWTDLNVTERDSIAEAIAVGAIRYLMVQYSPIKPIVFDMDAVVSFEGNTALYLQYALVRVGSILRKAEARADGNGACSNANLSLLRHETEYLLVLHLSRFPAALRDALRTQNVNIAAEYAYNLAAQFSHFYRDCPILQAAPDLRDARLRLLCCVQSVMTLALGILGIPIVDRL